MTTLLTFRLADITLRGDRCPVRVEAPNPAVVFPVELWPASPSWKRLCWTRDIFRELRLGGLTPGQIGPFVVLDTRALADAESGAVVGAWIPAASWAAWSSIAWGYVASSRKDRPVVVSAGVLHLAEVKRGGVAEILKSKKFPLGRDPHHVVPGSPAMQHKIKQEMAQHRAEVNAAKARMKRGYVFGLTRDGKVAARLRGE